MTRVLGKPYHFLASLRAWDFSSVHVLPSVFLDRCYEGMELWAKNNLWPTLEHASETRIMVEPYHVVLEQQGRPLKFPDDRTLLFELDGWTVFNRRKFLFECTVYRCGRKEQEQVARVYVGMTGVRIEDPESWAAVPSPLAPQFADRVLEFPGDHGLAAARYQHELRQLEGADWISEVSLERVASPHLCEFTDMAVFMNHSTQVAADCHEQLLASLKARKPEAYPAFAASLARPLSTFAIDMKTPVWYRESFSITGRCCQQAGVLYFDYAIHGLSPRRLCERFLAVYR